MRAPAPPDDDAGDGGAEGAAPARGGVPDPGRESAAVEDAARVWRAVVEAGSTSAGSAALLSRLRLAELTMESAVIVCDRAVEVRAAAKSDTLADLLRGVLGRRVSIELRPEAGAEAGGARADGGAAGDGAPPAPTGDPREHPLVREAAEIFGRPPGGART